MRTASCHPERKHWAKGLCRTCWSAQYRKSHLNQHSQSTSRYIQKRRREDPLFRLRLILRNRIWNALKGGIKSSSTARLLGCSIETLKSRIELQFKTGMSWDNYGEIWEVDHITPCAAFNLAVPEQQKACFHYTNLQPLFAGENRAKGDKILKEN